VQRDTHDGHHGQGFERRAHAAACTPCALLVEHQLCKPVGTRPVLADARTHAGQHQRQRVSEKMGRGGGGSHIGTSPR
jgi:hypothetical protein